jgi:hypothetical protein
MDENLSTPDNNTKRFRRQWFNCLCFSSFFFYFAYLTYVSVCPTVIISSLMLNHERFFTDDFSQLLFLRTLIHFFSNNLLVCVCFCSISILYIVCKAPFVWAFIHICTFSFAPSIARCILLIFSVFVEPIRFFFVCLIWISFFFLRKKNKKTFIEIYVYYGRSLGWFDGI